MLGEWMFGGGDAGLFLQNRNDLSAYQKTWQDKKGRMRSKASCQKRNLYSTQENSAIHHQADTLPNEGLVPARVLMNPKFTT
jgi:hypothetical protein